MLIQMRTIVTEKGYGERVVERWSQPSPVETMPGFIDRTVMLNRRSREHDEVVVMVRWESEEAWRNWEKSDVHIQGHRQNKDRPKPEFILSTTVNMYEVKTVRQGSAGAGGEAGREG